MTELDKLKAFISNFYATDYMTELGYGGMFVALIAILISCADGVNGFELILMIVILAIETAVIVLHIRKRMNNIFLYSGLGAIAFSSMAVLLFTNYASHIGENYILSVITFTGLFFIMPAIMSWVAVIRRIGNGYYAKSMERTNLFNWNPTSYLGLAVGVVAVTRILTDNRVMLCICYQCSFHDHLL